MKRFIIFIFGFAILYPSFAQNWNPFPFEQETFFKTKIPISDMFTHDAPDGIMSFKFDSVNYKPDGTAIYYDQRVRQLNNIECHDSLFKETKLMLLEKPIFALKNDSFALRNDTLIYDHYIRSIKSSKVGNVWISTEVYTPYWFYIPLNSKVGNSWDIINPKGVDTTLEKYQKISFKCTSLGVDTILSTIQDSVKIIEISINNQVKGRFVLSKNYGLITFPPFNNLFQTENNNLGELNIAGLDNKGTKMGYVPKKYTFNDFFQLKVGDIKYWVNSTYSLTPGDYVRSDSIINVERTDEYIRYDYYCVKYDYDDVSYPIKRYYDSDTILYSDFEQIIENNFNTIFIVKSLFSPVDYVPFIFGGNILIPSTTIHLGKPLIEGIDYSYWIHNNGEQIYYSDDSICQIGMITDHNMWRSYYPIIGNDYISLELNSTLVVGFKMDGKIYGNIPKEFTSGVRDYESSAYIFPNPARDFINTAAYFGWQYQIYDLLGSCVQKGLIDSENINVASLPTGFYTIRFFKEGKQVIEKMMKE